MTEQEALEKVKKDLDKAEAINNGLVTTTISALRRVYNLVNRFVPKKPNKTYNDALICPRCKTWFYIKKPYCWNCGQKIDWSEE